MNNVRGREAKRQRRTKGDRERGRRREGERDGEREIRKGRERITTCGDLYSTRR